MGRTRIRRSDGRPHPGSSRLDASRPIFTSGRSRRGRLVACALAAVVAGPAAWSQIGPDPGVAASAVQQGPAGQPAGSAAGGDAQAESPAVARTEVFGRFEQLELHLPSDDTMLVAFHEASLPAALELTPSGHLRTNDNTTKFQAPPEAPGPDYVVMSSRGRPHPATSAADLVLRDDEPVLSPVTGEVADVRPYQLYGTHPDHRIEIRPDARPDLRVVLIHVAGVDVEVGDRVEAGVTAVAATANRFPFASHVDRFFDPDRWPHVHLEVKHAR